MNSAWPLISAGLLMGAGGSLHCLTMCSGLQRMTLRGIPIVTVRTATGDATRRDRAFLRYDPRSHDHRCECKGRYR